MGFFLFMVGAVLGFAGMMGVRTDKVPQLVLPCLLLFIVIGLILHATGLSESNAVLVLMVGGGLGAWLGMMPRA